MTGAVASKAVVVVGGGQTAAVACRALRRKGYDGQVILVGDETERPYQRPPLSKEYLTDSQASGLYLLPEQWTAAQEVEVRTGVRALKISASDRSVLLDDGSSLPADQVLIATGGRPRALPNTTDYVGDRVLYLRTRADADRLREHLRPGAAVLLVGGGFIGAEVASAACSAGAEVTMLEAGPVPLAHALGSGLGSACARLWTEAGVDLRVDAPVRQVTQRGDEVLVETSSGSFTGDVAVIGVGTVPNQEIASDSGIDVGNGILVDEHCRTSLQNVFAAGDVANHYHPIFGERMRVEHFDNANRQASVAVSNMLGRAVAYDDPHWFWSDQFGANLQYVGHASPEDDMHIRGAVEDHSWSAFFMRDGRVRAAFAVNAAEDVMAARELIGMQVEVPTHLLADTNTDLVETLEQM
jgi:3-phenylpropionate/trans-cinnamate dioxygenase ferredoxin reductase component